MRCKGCPGANTWCVACCIALISQAGLGQCLPIQDDLKRLAARHSPWCIVADELRQAAKLNTEHMLRVGEANERTGAATRINPKGARCPSMCTSSDCLPPRVLGGTRTTTSACHTSPTRRCVTGYPGIGSIGSRNPAVPGCARQSQVDDIAPPRQLFGAPVEVCYPFTRNWD